MAYPHMQVLPQDELMQAGQSYRALLAAVSQGNINRAWELIAHFRKFNPNFMTYGSQAIDILKAAIQPSGSAPTMLWIVLEILGSDPPIHASECDLMHEAARQNLTWALQMLLKRHANVNQRDINRNTPLMGAAAKGSVHALKLLLDTQGVDIFAVNLNHQTAMDLASDRDCAELLQAAEQTALGAADPVAPGRAGGQHLLRYIAKGYIPEAVVLLRRHAGVLDINVFDAKGHSALMLAAQGGWTEMLAALLEQPNVKIAPHYAASSPDRLALAAIESGNEHTLQVLLKDARVVSKLNLAKLKQAAYSEGLHGRPDMVELINRFCQPPPSAGAANGGVHWTTTPTQRSSMCMDRALVPASGASSTGALSALVTGASRSSMCEELVTDASPMAAFRELMSGATAAGAFRASMTSTSPTAASGASPAGASPSALLPVTGAHATGALPTSVSPAKLPCRPGRAGATPQQLRCRFPPCKRHGRREPRQTAGAPRAKLPRAEPLSLRPRVPSPRPKPASLRRKLLWRCRYASLLRPPGGGPSGGAAACADLVCLQGAIACHHVCVEQWLW